LNASSRRSKRLIAFNFLRFIVNAAFATGQQHGSREASARFALPYFQLVMATWWQPVQRFIALQATEKAENTK
jgi:hypothetical protein